MISNALALVGLVVVGLAIDNLAGPWWALLFAGIVLVLVAYVLHDSGQSSVATAEVKRR